MRELPQGWATATIGAITSEPAQRVPSDSEEFTYIDIASIDRETKRISNAQRLDGKRAPSRARKVVREGDVLVSMTRPNLNAVALVTKEFDGQIASTGFDVLRPEEVEPRWIFGIVRSADFIRQMSDLVQGALYPAVRSRDVRAYRVPVAPLREQKRIADKLDSLLAKVASCRERLNRVPQILKKFREAVLEAAVSGRLTEEWRGRPRKTTIGPWESCELTSVCPPERVITYGVIKLGAEVKYGVPCLRTSNVRWLRIDENGIKRIATRLSAEYGRTVIRGDEVLVNVRGTLGGVAAVAPHMIGWNVSREVAVVPVTRKLVDPRFLALWIAADSSQRWLTRAQRGVAYTGINIEDLRALPVRVPSLPEQFEIIRRVDDLFALAGRLQRRHEDALARVEKLTPSVLAKAFRGELVPQDRNDEPASVMREHIRNQREAAANGGRSLRKRRVGPVGKEERNSRAGRLRASSE